MAFLPCPKPSVQIWYFSVAATLQQSPQALGLQMLPELAPHHCPALPSGSSFGTISCVPLSLSLSLAHVCGLSLNPFFELLTHLVPTRASTVGATAIDSQLTIDEQLQLSSVRLCTNCVLCTDVLNSGSQYHILSPSSVDLLRQLGILNRGNYF